MSHCSSEGRRNYAFFLFVWEGVVLWRYWRKKGCFVLHCFTDILQEKSCFAIKQSYYWQVKWLTVTAYTLWVMNKVLFLLFTKIDQPSHQWWLGLVLLTDLAWPSQAAATTQPGTVTRPGSVTGPGSLTGPSDAVVWCWPGSGPQGSATGLTLLAGTRQCGMKAWCETSRAGGTRQHSTAAQTRGLFRVVCGLFVFSFLMKRRRNNINESWTSHVPGDLEETPATPAHLFAKHN